MGKIINLLVITLFAVGCTANGSTIGGSKEKPEEVVKKFYSYVEEGGPTTLKEAYKLISAKHYKMNEEQFQGITSKYSKDMKINIIGSDIKNGIAVVKIEYSVPSAFGGSFTAETEIHLDMDDASRSWKIDFTGETFSSDAGQATKAGM